jgi:hypothetical protein
VRFWRHIPLFCAALILFAVQCRAQCVAIPHAAAQHAPECPLHKSKAPVESTCSHAPQWDLDDSRQFVAILPEAPALVAFDEAPLKLAAPTPVSLRPAPVLTSLRL